MIFTITPNPALDLGGVVDLLIPNEKAYVHNETRFPGGNAINAARIIHKLGYPVVAGGFLGGGVGAEIKKLLNGEGVKTRTILIQGNSRINVTVSSRKTHLQTRLSFPGPEILPSEIEKLLTQIEKLSTQSLVILGGSFPPGFKPHHVKNLAKTAHSKDIPLIIDVPGKLLKSLIPCKPHFIKPNLIEFCELIGKKVETIPEVIQHSRKLLRQIPWICISSVENGALLLGAGKAWHGQIPPIHVKTTVGAGDSMVGAMSTQLWLWKKENQNPDGETLLRWGLAAATATLITPGTTLGDKKDILRYYPQVKIREITK